ncbi:phage tail sheath C-terminal domain-containing protein, partial [Brevibacillus sp. MCWH]|uniref:phage tail sheath C-terminal domain-containing protein n=1 Tax=Brevibacillus sp. MCWH TaxID=2508871 RepID=UPI002738CC52
DNGEFVIYHDGEKVKVGRGVTSLVTTTQDKGDDFKKIKIVDILDLMYMDIRKTIEDKYIGKYANSYENKVLLIQAINAYYEQLEIDGLLDTGKNSAEIDLDAQRVYLRSIGVDVDSMKDQQIKEANTRDKVFLLSRVRPLDAIEDIDMKVLI